MFEGERIQDGPQLFNTPEFRALLKNLFGYPDDVVLTKSVSISKVTIDDHPFMDAELANGRVVRKVSKLNGMDFYWSDEWQAVLALFGVSKEVQKNSLPVDSKLSVVREGEMPTMNVTFAGFRPKPAVEADEPKVV